MASRFNCLGFHIRNEYEYSDLLRLAARKGRLLDTPAGGYFSWKLGNGIELWAQTNQRRQLAGLNPHFSGKAAQIVGITDLQVNRSNPLDGSFETWVNPDVDRMEIPPYVSGQYPLTFEPPCFDWFRNIPLPSAARIQLTAFAQDLEVRTADEEEWNIKIGPAAHADECFIPAGLLLQRSREIPASGAFLAGTVLSCRQLTNIQSRRHFFAAVIRTTGMDLDVVIPGELLDAPLEPGTFIRGNVCLSGMILEILETLDGLRQIHRSRLFFQTMIAGLTYQDHFEEVFQTLAFADRLVLVREPENPHDPRAIAVYAPDGVKLGYIPGIENSALSEIMDNGVEPAAHVVDKYETPFPRVFARVYLPIAENDRD